MLHGPWACITNKYMPSSAVMTVRIPTELLDALKERARQEGRTTSGEVVHLVRQTVEVRSRSRRRVKAWGMFAHLGEPAGLDDLIAARHEISAKLVRSVKRKPRT